MSKHAHVQQEQKSWVTQVNTGLQMKKAGEEMVAKALRARLTRVGEKAWLEQCESEWGWGRAQAYKHLNPDGMEKARERAAEERIHNVDVAPRQEAAVREREREREPRPAKWQPDAITKALSELSAAIKVTPASSIIADLQRMYDKGIGVDAGFKEAFITIRVWLDEVIEGIDPFIVSCAVNPSPDKE